MQLAQQNLMEIQPLDQHVTESRDHNLQDSINQVKTSDYQISSRINQVNNTDQAIKREISYLKTADTNLRAADVSIKNTFTKKDNDLAASDRKMA